jgi:hypothetical protein
VTLLFPLDNIDKIVTRKILPHVYTNKVVYINKAQENTYQYNNKKNIKPNWLEHLGKMSNPEAAVSIKTEDVSDVRRDRRISSNSLTGTAIKLNP